MSKNEKSKLSLYLSSLRIGHNYSLRGLAQGLHLSATFLSDLENGNRLPSGKVIDSLIGFYDLDFEQQRSFYDLLSEENGELPYDVVRFLKENPDELNKVVGSMRAAANTCDVVFQKK